MMDNQNKLMSYSYISDNEVVEKKPIFTLILVAQIINKKGFGRTKLYELLRTLGYLNKNNISYEKYVDEGYFINSETTIRKGLVFKRTNQVLVTVSGLNLIKKIVADNIK